MTIYKYTATTLAGEDVPLETWRGRVLLVVNTASACGFTPQYAGLQSLYQKYEPRGFTVMGFPCNQFGAQEPGDAATIGAFCEKNYGVTFPMFAKVEVKGAGAHQLFQYLTQAKPGILGTEGIKWNFTKFLIDRDGDPVARFAPQTKPQELETAIERYLSS
jgi:glutathione peroxidase